MIDIQDGIDEQKLAAITNNVIDQIKKLREEGLSWKQITKRVVKDMKSRQMTPYIIYHNQICGYPGQCEKLAEIAFFNEQGAVFACPRHYSMAEKMIYG